MKATAQSYGVQATMAGAYPDPGILTEVADLINAGKIKLPVSKILPLSETRQAQELIAARYTRGKIVLD